MKKLILLQELDIVRKTAEMYSPETLQKNVAALESIYNTVNLGAAENFRTSIAQGLDNIVGDVGSWIVSGLSTIPAIINNDGEYFVSPGEVRQDIREDAEYARNVSQW